MIGMTNPYAELLAMGLNEEQIDAYFRQQNSVDNIERFKSITAEMAYIYARKNKDYGNSFDISLDEDGLLVSKIRLGDKMKRFAQLIKKGYEQEVNDESVRDTLVDMANYAIMTVMWMDLQQEVEKQKEMGKASVVTKLPVRPVTAGGESLFPYVESTTHVINPTITGGADFDGDISLMDARQYIATGSIGDGDVG